MSKNKSKSRSEVEHLRGVIRRLKAQLKYYKNRAHIPDEPQLKEESEEDCPECGKGKLNVHDFYYITIIKCNMCEYEKRLKNGEETKN